MVQPVDAKQNYYVAREARLALESQRNDYMSSCNSSNFSQSVFDQLGDKLKDAQHNEFEGECNFDNYNSKVFNECCAKMSNPFAP